MMNVMAKRYNCEIITYFLRQNKTHISELIVVGVACVAVILRKRNNVNVCFEDNLRRVLEHSLRILLTNELLLRHLQSEKDSATTGPNTFSVLK